MGPNAQVKSVSMSEQRLANTQDIEQQAALTYELRMMYEKLGQTEQAEKHRITALLLYQKLFGKTPKFEFKK